MKHKWITLILAILFFLTCLTIYANRVLFPSAVKNFAIAQAQSALKRKVEIGSLHFNWLRGLLVDQVKVYQKDSSDILLQADKISVGLIFIPGFKQHKLILPFIHIESPYIHLIRQADGQWNFSDLLTLPSTKDEKPSPVAVTVTSISISNGKLILDDQQPKGIGTETFDKINLRTGFSLQGITFDGSLSVDKKQSFFSANGSYQPLNQSLNATVVLKNIKPLDYMSLVPIQLPLTVASTTIDEVNAQVQYEPKLIAIKGGWSIKNINLTLDKNNLQTDLDASNTEISIKDNSLISAKGLFTLNNVQVSMPDYSFKGQIKANVDDLLIKSPEDISLKASLDIQNALIRLPKEQSIKGDLNIRIDQGSLQKDSAHLEGKVDLTKTQINLNGQQNIQGNLLLANLKLDKNKDIITVNTALDFNDLDLQAPGKIIKGSLHLQDLKINYDQAKKLVDTSFHGSLDKGYFKLDDQKELSITPKFDLNLHYPIKDASSLEYTGHVSLQGARLEGLPFGPIENIDLDLDIKTDSAQIKSLSLSFIDTPIKASGLITHFAKPRLNIQAESERIDLSKLKTVAPDLLKTYGLDIDGETSFKIEFNGLAADPFSAEINARAQLKNVNVSSSTLKQNVKNINGKLRADGESLIWEDFTFELLNKTVTLNGQLNDFKNPKIKTTLASENLELKAKINKNDTNIDILDLSGHYMQLAFTSSGSVNISNKTPQLNIKNDLKFKLEDLSTILPDTKKSLEPLKISGDMDIDTSIKGPGTNWKNWTVNSNISSDLVKAAGFTFNNVNADINLIEGKLDKSKVTSKFYDGDLNILTTADLKNPTIPFDAALHLENTNVEKLKNDTAAKGEDIRGTLAFTTIANGRVTDIMNMKGNGSVAITQGYLMKKEFSSLFLIPELSNLVFTEASANFTIDNQKISTENLNVKSDGADLNGKGTVGFDHSLQFRLNPTFNADKIVQSDSLRKGPSALIASAAGQYLTITIDGTIEKPVVKTIKKPSELIKKTGQIIKDNVGQILQGFFQ